MQVSAYDTYTEDVQHEILPRCTVKVKVQLPHYTGLDRPLGLQEVEARRISRQSAHEGGMPSEPAAFTPQIFLVLISVMWAG